MHKVTTVTYESNLLGGIIRYWEDNSEKLSPDASFELEYLDANGNALALPLTELVISNELNAVRLTVTVVGSHNLIDGNEYTTELEQIVSFRNMALSR